MATYNHTGQVVTDLERSKRFYEEVFGFKLWYEISHPTSPPRSSPASRRRSGSRPPI